MTAALRLVSSATPPAVKRKPKAAPAALAECASSEPMPTGDDLVEHFTAPEGESKEDRARRLARERKQRQRNKEKLAALKAEAVKVPLELYGGTVNALRAVCEAGGFTGPQAAEEAITLLLHGVERLIARDRHAFELLISPPSRSGVADA